MDGWKVSTIVLSVVAAMLLIVVVVETFALVFIVGVGLEYTENEATCELDVCENYNYTSYYLDDRDVCYCYLNGELVYKEKIE